VSNRGHVVITTAMGSCFKFGLLKKKNFYEFQHPYLERESSGTYRHSKTDLSNWNAEQESYESQKDSHTSSATTNAGDVVFVATPKEERSVDVEGFMSSPQTKTDKDDSQSVSSAESEEDLEYPPERNLITDTVQTVEHEAEESHNTPDIHVTEPIPSEPEGYATEYVVESTTVATESSSEVKDDPVVPERDNDSLGSAECHSVESGSEQESPRFDDPVEVSSYTVTSTEVTTVITTTDHDNRRSSTVSNASSANDNREKEKGLEVKQVNFHDSANEVYVTPSNADYSFSSSEAESHQNEQNEEYEGLQSSAMVNVPPEADHYDVASEEITLDVNSYTYESPSAYEQPQEHAEMY